MQCVHQYQLHIVINNIGSHQKPLSFTYVLFCITLVNAKLPTFMCQVDQYGGCLFNDIVLSESQPNWQPTANTSDYSLIKNVQFTGCVIPVLTSDICRTFRSITKFWLYSQHVRRIPADAFNNCTKLEIISIVGNPLTKISENTFKKVQRLSTLHMFNNQIGHFDSATFDKLTQLEYLDVSGNNLTKFLADLLHKNRRL